MKVILELITTNTTEDKPFISIARIQNLADKYIDFNGKKLSERVVRTMVTKLINNNYLFSDKSRVKLNFSIQLIK